MISSPQKKKIRQRAERAVRRGTNSDSNENVGAYNHLKSPLKKKSRLTDEQTQKESAVVIKSLKICISFGSQPQPMNAKKKSLKVMLRTS